MRSLFISTVILSLSLGLAWTRFTKEPNKIGDNEVLVMPAQESDLEIIEWLTEKADIRISKKQDNLGTYLWVEYTDKKDPEKPQSKTYKAGENGNVLIKELSPLIGIRTIENPSLQDLGLDTPKTTLQITKNGQIRKFFIGNETYGTKDLYVQDTDNNDVFLIDDKKFRNLINGRTALPDRALFSYDTKTATSATISVIRENISKTTHLQHQYWQDASKATWTYQETPDLDNTQLQTWMEKLLKLSNARYISPEDDAGNFQEIFQMELQWEGKAPQHLIIYKDPNDPTKNLWAKSEHTREYVKITSNGLQELLDDMTTVFP